MARISGNTKSPVRLLAKGLHGGLGAGNLGAVVSGHGVGKSAVLVGLALDELLRGGTVLHVAIDEPIARVRDHYGAVFEALASTSQLDDAAPSRTGIEQHRYIQAYRGSEFNASKLAHAVKVESEAGDRPTLVVIDGLDLTRVEPDDLAGIGALAQELSIEIWMTAQSESEVVDAIPPAIAPHEDSLSVILALEPRGRQVTLRALKDHDNPDLLDLHVSLDPTTLLLVPS